MFGCSPLVLFSAQYGSLRLLGSPWGCSHSGQVKSNVWLFPSSTIQCSVWFTLTPGVSLGLFTLGALTKLTLITKQK